MNEIRTTGADVARFRRRIWAVVGVVLVAFGLVASRLAYLQISRHADLAEQAENNRTAVVPIVPNRGLIVDRNGEVLATNYSAYTLEVTPSKVKNLDAEIDRISRIVEITPRERRRFKKLLDESRNFESVPLRTRLTDEEVARFAAQRFRFPGVEIKARLFRSYPFGEVASHVVGYIGRINQKEKDAIDDSDEAANYRGTDHIGKLGVEQSYESELHGKTGVEQMETSAGGRAVRMLASHPATSGATVVLSLDIKLQKMIEDLFGDRRGALVALDPQTGEVLAMVSKPTFDPNLFVDGIDQENWSALNDSPDKPLLNRALRGTYPPGSTYKPFMGLAALETGRRTPATVINDPGYYIFAGHRFGTPDGYLGSVDLQRAIMLSSNVYFYSLANEMGVDAIHDFMAPLGFGQITGIDLGGELRGVLPSTEWKRNAYKRTDQRKWYAGETTSLGIGQGYNAFTMLQLAEATSILADGGIRRTPHVVSAVREPGSDKAVPVPQPAAVDLHFKSANLAAVRGGMIAVTTGGTSKAAFAGAGYVSAGKTGTAQAVTQAKNTKYNSKALEERQRDHALYTAYAPADNPKIVVSMVVENAGWGSGAAAPIARRIFDYWLLGQYPSEADMAATRLGKSAAPIGTPRQVMDVELPSP